MGYSISQLSCTNFLIKKEDFSQALVMLKRLAMLGTIKDERSKSGYRYAWVENSELEEATTLLEAIKAWRWNADVDSDGNIIDLYFEGEKLGDDEIFLKALAPFVKSGEIEMSGEDSAFWKWVFRDGKLVELSGRVVYEEG